MTDQQSTSATGKGPDGRPVRPQFGLAALFWLVFAAGLYFAYLRRYHYTAVLLGCLAALQGLATGAILGCMTRRLTDAAYWATLCAVFGFVSLAGEPTLGVSMQFAWTTVGAVSGALCGTVAKGRAVRRVLLGCGGGALAMWSFLLLTPGGLQWKTFFQPNTFDAICAPLIGALIGVLIEIIEYVELNRRVPRYTTATWLLCAVLAGNLLSQYLV